VRDESQSLVGAIQEAVKIGEEGGVKVEIYHLKAAYRPEFGKLMPQAIAVINAARARGVDVAADMYVYTAGGTGIDATVPTWVWKEGKQKGIERLGDPAVRARLKRELAAPSTPEWQNLVQSSGGWEHVILANSYNPSFRNYEGKSFAEIGASLGKDPADVAWDILIAALPNRAYALYQMIGEQDILTALAQPWVSIGSDAASAAKAGQLDGIGLPHPRSYGNFARVIEEYVEKEHALTLEEAVRKMSGWPSARMSLGDRGLIREGMYADLLVFDPAKVRENATYEHPTVLASGFDDVIVSGVVKIDEGKMVPAKSGMVLRHACPAG
jgi:N-acyl-D-amino-acid deacylase